MQNWAKHLIGYKDGRFATDKLFGFFALNHITRMRNANSGQWFIDQFYKNCPDTLSELQESIERGDRTFVNSLSYHNKCIKGSTPSWFKMKQELYSWINHHVEAGNGPPTMFITLSCAEFMWSDLLRVIKLRIEAAGEDSSNVYVGSPKLAAIINDHSATVQEYFQVRVKAWLETVGKTVFRIKHHWVRYEFAPGRGQIHTHLVAIPDNHSIFKMCQLDLKKDKGKLYC